MKCKFVLSMPQRHQLNLWGVLGYTATSVSANSLISLSWLEIFLIPVKTSCVLCWTQNRSPSKQENLELHLYWIDHACFYWRARSLLCRMSLKRTIIFFLQVDQGVFTMWYSQCSPLLHLVEYPCDDGWQKSVRWNSFPGKFPLEDDNTETNHGNKNVWDKTEELFKSSRCFQMV